MFKYIFHKIGLTVSRVGKHVHCCWHFGTAIHLGETKYG